MKKLVFFLAALIILPVFQSCETEDEETPPDIPPIETMVMDLDIFNNDEEKSALNMQNYLSSLENSDIVSYKNFFNAGVTVVFWQLILTVNLVIPIASFGVAVDQQAEFIGDATWQWKYNFQSAGTYTARLTGQIQASDIEWNMYISKDGVGAFDEVKWYEGTSALDGNSGQWILYKDADDPSDFLQIDWEKTDDEIGSIKYTYINAEEEDGSDDPAYGSYIKYGLVDAEYNVFYQTHIYNENKAVWQDTDIEVNTADTVGRIKGEHLYDDSKWHCWNSLGQDVDCE